jgi:hypothetical protein
VCKVKGDTHITALSNNGFGEGEGLCKVRDNNGERKTFSIGSNFVFIYVCVNKSWVNEFVYAVVHLFRLRYDFPERKLNIYNALIKSSLFYVSETWRLTENNQRRVEATEMDALRRSSRISRKERIKNVTIRQQNGLEETIVKEIEQNQLTWYGHVQRMAEARLPKIALKWTPKQKRARGRPKKNWMESIRKAMNERNL